MVQNSANDTIGNLRTATGKVNVDAAAAPSDNMLLRATGPNTSGWEYIDIPVNAQSGTSYTFVDGDRSKLVTFSNASAIASTLPQAGASSQFISGWYVFVENRGAGTLTISPTTSTIDGAASLALTQNQGALIVSDGTNYFTMRGFSSAAAFTNLPYTSVTGTSQTMAANNGYLTDNAALVTCTLPTTAAFGTVIEVLGRGAGGWRIAQNAGQQIIFGDTSTTAGVVGRLDSTHRRDGVHLICTSANTEWTVLGSQGNITVT